MYTLITIFYRIFFICFLRFCTHFLRLPPVLLICFHSQDSDFLFCVILFLIAFFIFWFHFFFGHVNNIVNPSSVGYQPTITVAIALFILA
jgi:hypothetical protein